MNLLLLEDDSAAAESLTLAPSETERKYSVTHVNSMAAAVSTLRFDPLYDVALVDSGLPDARSTQATPCLCERFPNLVVVVLSGETGPSLASEIIRLGAQDFLQKREHGAIGIDRVMRSL